MKTLNSLRSTFFEIYGNHTLSTECFDHLIKAIKCFKAERIQSLIQLDQTQKEWFFQPNLIGMTLYVDLFSGTLKDLENKMDYFKELGITFVHLMPLLKSRDGENDGGYAVEDYRSIDPKLGSLDDFKSLLLAFRENGIYVCIDYVINHVAKEHEWAQKALKGDRDMQDMFIMFDSDHIPQLFNRTVPEVLPDKSPGNFTYYPEIKRYVFTSFSDFQWDLNFENPRVFVGMVENMLYLANLGVNMIRLDAIPFMWKTLGTTCRNLPQIHHLIHMLHLIKEEACPSVALLGEAIVEPHEIVKYFGRSDSVECEIMYNANLMVDIFNSFAARDVRLLMLDANLYHIPTTGSWMNYVRCHDDIGWGFNEHAISSMGFDPYMHKQFLISFYGGRFPDSFSNGEDYQFNPLNNDARTNGTLASLLGLEKAKKANDSLELEHAINRINLAHALIMFYRGFPLIYSGDEIATLNDQSYLTDSSKKNDGRWVHRPLFDWERAQKRNVPKTHEYRVFQSLKNLIQIRKTHPCFDGRVMQYALDVNHNGILVLVKRLNDETCFGLFNFTEHIQTLDLNHLRQNASSLHYENMMNHELIDLTKPNYTLNPYAFVWAKPKPSS